MPAQEYSVGFRPGNTLPGPTAYTTLTNVQEINLNIGRQRQLDSYSASSATVVCRIPDGIDSAPFDTLTVGDQIRIQNTTGTAYDVYQGRVSDVTVTYAIPYPNGVGVSDIITIEIEGHFSLWGRRSRVGALAIPSDTFTNQLGNDIYVYYRSGGSDPVLAAAPSDGTWADWFSQVCLTLNARLQDSVDSESVLILSPYYRGIVPDISFSDTTNDSNHQVYQQIRFWSLADNYYTQVIVDPSTGATQSVNKSGVELRTYSISTLHVSEARALDYANYLLNNYSDPAVEIASITCFGLAQNSFQLDKIGVTNTEVQPFYLSACPGAQVEVTFRGSTLTCIIEGVTATLTPSDSTFTFHLSGADLNAYLLLDNAVFGKLDENKLGY
jgi:hypothetical protein